VPLSAHNQPQVYVPPGIAHGILVTSPDAIVEYKCTDLYSPVHERCLAWNDPTVGVEWPLPPGQSPILSAKDLAGATLEVAEAYS
jgi:dTDP-4-dehydrorhamnose 3,5-epimerase